MRNLSANALAKLSAQYGSEPINIVEIQWSDGGSRIGYSDRTIGSIKGRILELSSLDNVVNVQGGGESASLSMTLDDSNGSIKAIFDNHDVHKRPVWVYQWFDGLDLDDKFLIFRGEIYSPVVWNEGARTVSLTVVTKIEDKEVGFSAEEGTFRNIPDSLIGKPWPMIFGTVLDLPTIGLTKAIVGTTQQGVGIVSGKELHKGIHSGNDANRASAGVQLAVMSAQASALGRAAHLWGNVGTAQADAVSAQYLDQLNQVEKAISQLFQSIHQVDTNLKSQRESDEERFNNSEGPSKINILGGEDFPQSVPVEVQIGSGLFTGIFDCQEFRIISRRHADNETKAQNSYDLAMGTGKPPAPTPSTYFNFTIEAPGALPFGYVVQKGHVLSQPVAQTTAVDQVAQHFWADAGSRVTLTADADQYYIASITPGEVLAVKAYKRFEGVRRLVNVPSSMWEQVDRDYGTVQVAMVKLTKQLSSIEGQGWEDDIYVTYQSSVGPNTVDIMEWLIGQYSSLQIDEDSFDHVRMKLEPFPSSFAMFDRPQILDALRDIAFQARCALYIKDETVYLKYLPEEPDADLSITDSDVANQSIEVMLTSTEDIVTKMVVNWRPTYAEDDERKIIFRHNVEKYGVQEETFDWYIYNQPDIIRKAATFWLIRKANTWKRIKFQTYLDKLQLETFDTVSLEMTGGLVANSNVKAIVEDAEYDSDNNTIRFECLVPVKAGTMTPYKFFWPELVLGSFPAEGDFGGGSNIGAGASGDLPVISIDVPNVCNDGGLFIGGPNIIFAGPADLGDPTPADTGFQAQQIIPDGTDFDLDVSPNPQPSLSTTYAPEIPIPDILPITNGTSIDLHKTVVFDSATNRSSRLSTLIREVNGDDQLVLSADALVGDGDNEAPFAFEYDDETDQFGAGIAFLEEGD